MSSSRTVFRSELMLQAAVHLFCRRSRHTAPFTQKLGWKMGVLKVSTGGELGQLSGKVRVKIKVAPSQTVSSGPQRTPSQRYMLSSWGTALNSDLCSSSIWRSFIMRRRLAFIIMSDSESYELNMPVTTLVSKDRIVPAVDITDLLQVHRDQALAENCFRREEQVQPKSNPAGFFDKTCITGNFFEEQRRKFMVLGYAADPNLRLKSVVIDQIRFPGKELEELQAAESQSKKARSRQIKQTRVEHDNPWAGYGQCLDSSPITEQQKARIQQFKDRHNKKYDLMKNAEPQEYPYSTTFHLDKEIDYKGRSYIEPPSDFVLRKGECYVPRSCTKIWPSAKKAGYAVAKYFPKTGHYALVGNIQGTILLFDVLERRVLTRTYSGHSEGVRGLEFFQDGKQFLSCSYDQTVLHWDTETGKVIRRYRPAHVPLCVRLNPEFEKQNSFLAGLSTKHIHQIDMRSGKVELTYDQHLAGVNTLTFVDYRRFVSTSDDKKVFLWEFGVPVVIKHISEPEMHPITYACVHPRGLYYVGQASDNRCVVYEYKDNTLRSNKKKVFTGHMNTGYTCGVSFSNDGKYIAAGDEKGRLFFYDWKTCKNYRTLEAHDLATVAVEWHPCDSNQVLTCGWEGTVKLWE